MRYHIRSSRRFDKSVKRCKKRGLDIKLLKEVIVLLEEYGKLPESYKPHLLRENMSGIWECHIEDDWLLTWRQNDYELTLLLLDTGTHSDIF